MPSTSAGVASRRIDAQDATNAGSFFGKCGQHLLRYPKIAQAGRYADACTQSIDRHNGALGGGGFTQPSDLLAQ